MKGVNPFEAVPSLHDFATRVAQDLKNGRRVLAVIGPYSDTKFREAVRPLAGYGDKRWRELCRVYQSTEWSEEAAGTGVLLIVAHVFHRSAGLILNGDGPVWCDVVHVCPTNLSRVELRSLAGEMLAKEKLSDVFRTMIIDFSCELCAGSISSLRDALELCLNKNYRPPSAFVHPHDVVKRCREEQERRTNARLEALDAEAERHAPKLHEFHLLPAHPEVLPRRRPPPAPPVRGSSGMRLSRCPPCLITSQNAAAPKLAPRLARVEVV